MQISQHYNINFTLNGKPLKIWKIVMDFTEADADVWDKYERFKFQEC